MSIGSEVGCRDERGTRRLRLEQRLCRVRMAAVLFSSRGFFCLEGTILYPLIVKKLHGFAVKLTKRSGLRTEHIEKPEAALFAFATSQPLPSLLSRDSPPGFTAGELH